MGLPTLSFSWLIMYYYHLIAQSTISLFNSVKSCNSGLIIFRTRVLPPSPLPQIFGRNLKAFASVPSPEDYSISSTNQKNKKAFVTHKRYFTAGTRSSKSETNASESQRNQHAETGIDANDDSGSR